MDSGLASDESRSTSGTIVLPLVQVLSVHRQAFKFKVVRREGTTIKAYNGVSDVSTVR
jgi:hypothetical protein